MPDNPDRKELGPMEYTEYVDLLSRAKENLEELSGQERERLLAFGHYHLETEHNPYEARRAFEATQNFEELRKMADDLLQHDPGNYELPLILVFLEDHNGLCGLLNRQDISWPKGDIYWARARYETIFQPLKGPLIKYVNEFLSENEMPDATGTLNAAADLIAIKNLSEKYDVAVPIARGGLIQGAIADLWDMPTRIVDIAAHGRKVPRGKWVDSISPDDFKGKNVLLFDKDAVTGASVRKAVNMLDKYEPASKGIYFTHDILAPGKYGVGTKTDGLPGGLEVYAPNQVSLANAGDVYIEAHEKLATPYGQRKHLENLFLEEADRLETEFPELARAFREFIAEQCRVFDSLNPYLAGVSKVREGMILRMNNLYGEHKQALTNGIYKLPGVTDNFVRILTTTRGLYLGFESDFVTARYVGRGEEAAKKRNVENPHYPSDALAAFQAAQQAVKENFDVALIVGPEGFAYEPYFQDLGLATLAVNIPESGINEPRVIKIFDDLSALTGKRVLVVEDDVRTGATLQKLLEQLAPHDPKYLGLYLGQPEKYQKTANIPTNFANVYMAQSQETAGQEFIEFLESRGLKLFKNISSGHTTSD